MFEEDLDALPTADLLESAAELRALSHRSEARLLQHALAYADRFHPSAHPGRTSRRGRRSCDGRERAVVLGGDGCPEILEFAIAEFGVLLGISPWVAADYLGQALALRHRFPFTWARVLSGGATPWKACRIVADCKNLSEEAAARVDKRVAGLVDSITPARLEKIIKAARMHVDPEKARAEAAEKTRERGVFIGQSNEHGTKTMFIKAAAGAVARHEATLSAIADALKTFGDTRRVQTRRAEAVGIIADARFTEELLAQARAHRSTNPDSAAPDNAVPDNLASDNLASDCAAPDNFVPDNAAPDGSASDRATADSLTADNVASGKLASSSALVRAPGGDADDRDRLTDPADPARRTEQAKRVERAKSVASDTSVGRGDAAPDSGARSAGSWVDDDLLDDLLHDPASGWDEPAWDDEADVPDPLDTDRGTPVEPFDLREPHVHIDPDDGDPLDTAAERALNARLAQIKHDAYTSQPDPHSHITGTGTGTGCNGTGTGTGVGANGTAGSTGTNNSSGSGAGSRSGSSGRGGVRVRPGQTEVYVHLTDLTLATGTGVLRAETLGPMLAEQLTELIGYGPYTVKPVIDLNDAVSVDAYEIPDRIRERVKLTHPVEQFPYGTQETRRSMDLDHLRPYDPLGPPGQTSTSNLAPLGRYPHRVKTHALGWDVRRVDYKTLEWSTPHGFRFHVDPTGTHRVDEPR